MKIQTRKQRFSVGFTAGLAAGVIATGVMLFLSITLQGISLPEVFGSELTALMPPPLFDFLHHTIGGDAKHYLFYGILVGQCLVFALSAALYNLFLFSRTGMHEKLHLHHGLLLALILLLLTGFVLLPLTGAGIFGAQLAPGLTNTTLSLAVVGMIFGSLYVYIQNWLEALQAHNVAVPLADGGSGRLPTSTLSRRTMLQRGLLLAGVGLLGVGAWRFITQGANTASAPVARLVQQFRSKITPPPIPNYGTLQPARFLSPEVTSNNEYYIVSKNLFSDPVVDAGSWRLTVNGQVEQPFTLTYSEMMTLPVKQQYESMMCVSNEVGGQYMSNALWEGIPLVDLLNRAGLKPGATKIVFYAADDYSDSIHLTKALEPTTLLAVRMNGAILPQGHGFPARMLVPGIYGMKHCKWVTRIEVVNQDYQGYWQQRGWSDPAPIRLTSRIDTPLIGSTVPVNRTTYVAGVAFSGNKGISEVDVSLDNGQTWQRATLKRPLSKLTWVLWELAWLPTQRGTYIIIVRAIDMEGNVQVPNEEPPLPNGSSGYHTINITVS